MCVYKGLYSENFKPKDCGFDLKKRGLWLKGSQLVDECAVQRWAVSFGFGLPPDLQSWLAFFGLLWAFGNVDMPSKRPQIQADSKVAHGMALKP